MAKAIALVQLEPLSGPVEGGTALTIDGENLGLTVNDTSVTVAGHDCDLIHYHSAVRSATISVGAFYRATLCCGLCGVMVATSRSLVELPAAATR